jgi:hypothetical protein
MFDLFAEWSINGGASPTTSPALSDFWRAYADRFRSLVLYPPLREYRIGAEQSRHKLLEVNERLVVTVKEIRRTLSERHKIAQEAPRPSGTYTFDEPLGTRLRW